MASDSPQSELVHLLVGDRFARRCFIAERAILRSACRYWDTLFNDHRVDYEFPMEDPVIWQKLIDILHTGPAEEPAPIGIEMVYGISRIAENMDMVDKFNTRLPSRTWVITETNLGEDMAMYCAWLFGDNDLFKQLAAKKICRLRLEGDFATTLMELPGMTHSHPLSTLLTSFRHRILQLMVNTLYGYREEHLERESCPINKQICWAQRWSQIDAIFEELSWEVGSRPSPEGEKLCTLSLDDVLGKVQNLVQKWYAMKQLPATCQASDQCQPLLWLQKTWKAQASQWRMRASVTLRARGV